MRNGITRVNHRYSPRVVVIRFSEMKWPVICLARLTRLTSNQDLIAVGNTYFTDSSTRIPLAAWKPILITRVFMFLNTYKLNTRPTLVPLVVFFHFQCSYRGLKAFLSIPMSAHFVCSKLLVLYKYINLTPSVHEPYHSTRRPPCLHGGTTFLHSVQSFGTPLRLTRQFSTAATTCSVGNLCTAQDKSLFYSRQVAMFHIVSSTLAGLPGFARDATGCARQRDSCSIIMSICAFHFYIIYFHFFYADHGIPQTFDDILTI